MANTMTNSRDVIIKLKEVKEEKNLSLGDILRMMEENGDYLSKSTLSRIFSEGSEELNFKYEETIRPIANAILDVDNLEETDDLDTQALKVLLHYKKDHIRELEAKVTSLENALKAEKDKYHEKMEKEREQFQRSLAFLKEQVALKDKRMDLLLDSVAKKDEYNQKMLDRLLMCPNFKEGS